MNNTTITIIVILLLIIYLFDNIKELEEKILSNPNIKTEHLHPRRKYFQDLVFINNNIIKENIKKNIKPNKIVGLPVKDLEVLPAVLDTHRPSQLFNRAEKTVTIPSDDKFISGTSAPGSTTMVMGIPDSKENPLFMDNIETRFDFRYAGYN